MSHAHLIAGEQHDDVHPHDEGELQPAVHRPFRDEDLQPEHERHVQEVAPVRGVGEVANPPALLAREAHEPTRHGEGHRPRVKRRGGEGEQFDPQELRVIGLHLRQVTRAQRRKGHSREEEVSVVPVAQRSESVPPPVQPPADGEEQAVVDHRARSREQPQASRVNLAQHRPAPQAQHGRREEEQRFPTLRDEPVKRGIEAGQPRGGVQPPASPRQQRCDGVKDQQHLQEPQVAGRDMK